MAALYEDILVFVANNLKCSICLEMFTDPVTLTCGHSYCLKCIKDHLGRNQNQNRTCPQCRVPLPQKYNLKKNVTICNLLGLHDAGGREMWDQILTDQEHRKDMLMRRLNFMKEEIKRIEAELNIEHQERSCFTRTPDTSSSSSSLEVSSSSLDSNGADNSSSDLQSTWEESMEGSSQVDEFENMESDPGENLLDSDSLAAGFNSCMSSEFKAAALSGAFVLLSFSPQLGHRRLVFLPVRRRMEVSSSPSLRMQNSRFRACQWMADQEFAAGRHYWDVETGGCIGWAAGLAYATLARDEQLGRGRGSWCIEWSSGRFSAWHNNTETPLKQVCPSRVRVLLDMDVGQLSFWTVRDTVAELHSIPVEFSAPVRPIFWLFGTKQGNFLSFPHP